jgi:hypothetical protein
MKKFRHMSEGTQSLIVSLSLGAVAFGIAFAIKFLYRLL